MGEPRKGVPEYPAVAIHEAVINAVVHRDYSAFVRGTYIQIRLFADRLEIESPGGLFGNVTEETRETNRSTRNEALMRLMEDNDLVENRGSGIGAMITAMRGANLEPPCFEDTRTLFRVTFSNLRLMNPETIAWLNQGDCPLIARTPRDAQIWPTPAPLRIVCRCPHSSLPNGVSGDARRSRRSPTAA